MKKKNKLLISLMVFLIIMTNVAAAKNYQIKEEHSFIPVLMYHHFAEGAKRSDAATVTDPEVFKSQLSYLKSIGYETITDQDLLLFLEEGKRLPKKPLFIAIDDGYLSNYTYAYPILKELGMKATIYVIGRYIVSPNEPYLKHFNFDQAREMIESGVINIQSHTYDSHYKVNDSKLIPKPVLVTKIEKESQEEYEARIRDDLKKSKEILEKELGIEVTTLSYPYGAHNETVDKIAKEVGYLMALTIKKGVQFPGEDPYQIQRINVSGTMSGKDIDNSIQYYASVKNPKKIYFSINHKISDIIPLYINKTYYAPVKSLVEGLGASVKWDGKSQSVTIIGNGKEIQLSSRSNYAYVNQEKVYLPKNMILYKNTAYAPIRFLSEQLGAETTWDNNWLGSLKHIKLNLER